MTDLEDPIRNLYDICEKILEEHSSKIRVSTNNVVLDRMKSYQKVTKNAEIIQHAGAFLEVFKKNRIPILLDKSDKWLSEDVVIGRLTELKPKKKEQINITVIYKRASELKNSATERFKKISNTAIDLYIIHPETVYPETLLCRLYQAFDYFLSHDDVGTKKAVPVEDSNKLKVVIKKYLGLARLDVKPATQENNQVAVSPGKEEVTQTARASGAPPQFDIGTMLSSVINNPNIKKLMASITSSMTANPGAQSNPQDMLASTMSKLASKEFIDGVTETMKSLGTQMSPPVQQQSQQSSQSEPMEAAKSPDVYDALASIGNTFAASMGDQNVVNNIMNTIGSSTVSIGAGISIQNESGKVDMMVGSFETTEIRQPSQSSGIISIEELADDAPSFD